MAVAYITEHPKPRVAQGGLIPVAEMPPLRTQTVAIGVGSTQCALAFTNTSSQKCEMVAVHVDAICSIEFGSNPTATATSRRMAANTTEYFRVNPGDKIAVITNT